MKRLANRLKNLIQGAGELSPSCREAARLQSEALDHPLRFGQKIGLHLHLILCKWCRRYGRQIRFLSSAASQFDEHEQNPLMQPLRPDAVERIKHRLRAEKK